MPKKCRVMIVDDHPIVCEGLEQLISSEAGLEVCDTAGGSAGALQKLPSAAPDVMLIDLSLAGMDGLELIKQIKTLHSDVQIIVISMHDETLYAERVLRAGAMGYIMKNEATEVVIDAIRKVFGGQIHLSDRMSSRLLRSLVDDKKEMSDDPIASLSDRELEVFRLIGEGIGTRDIAENLNLSIKTIETYRSHIKNKMNISTASELARCAFDWASSL